MTVPDTPQQNGEAERMIRTITEKARCMLIGADLKKIFWGEAVLTATYIINITPTKALPHEKTPFEMWKDKKPKLKYLKVFGATAYVHNKHMEEKFDKKSWKGIFVGYAPNGYKVYDTSKGTFAIVRDVVFDETNFLSSRSSILFEELNFEKSYNLNNKNTIAGQISNKTNIERQYFENLKSDTNSSTNNSKIITEQSKTSSNSQVIDNEQSESDNNLPPQNDASHEDSINLNNKRNSNENLNLRRSNRLKTVDRISYEETDTTLDKHLLSSQSIVCKLPSSFQEIYGRDDENLWLKAINEELFALIKNNTWTIVDKSSDRNIIGCKWIFLSKTMNMGTR